MSHVTSVTTTIKDSSDEPKTNSEKEEEGGEDEGGEGAHHLLDIVLPAGKMYNVYLNHVMAREGGCGVRMVKLTPFLI